MEKKKLLIIGADRTQVPLVRAARELGCESYVVSIDGDYPALKIADHAVIQNIKDAEGVADAAERLHADGVVTSCLNMALPAVGAACDRCGLPGLSSKAAEASINKLRMKEMLAAEGVQTARYVKVSDEEALPAAIAEIGLPLVIKAVDLSASRGVNIVFSAEEAAGAFRRTMEETSEDYCIIEEYLSGHECSATAMVIDGTVVFVLPTGDLRYGENDELPVGHYVPYEDEPDILEQIDREVRKSIRALGITNSAINVDIMISGGKAYILELAGRFGGNAMIDLTTIYYGTDMYELLVKMATGRHEEILRIPFDSIPHTPAIARMLFSEKSGKLRKISLGEAPYIHPLSGIFVKEGDEVHAFTGPKDYLGQLIVTGTDIQDCRDNLAAATDCLCVEVE